MEVDRSSLSFKEAFYDGRGGLRREARPACLLRLIPPDSLGWPRGTKVMGDDSSNLLLFHRMIPGKDEPADGRTGGQAEERKVGGVREEVD